MSNLTPLSFSAELQQAIRDRNVLTTRSRMKVLSALKALDSDSMESKRNALHEKVVNEILSSEKSYLHQLEILLRFFMEPLESKQGCPKIFGTLHGNLAMLLKVNKELFTEIQNNINNIGGAFRKIAPYLKLYSVYAYDYRQVIQAIENISKGQHDLQQFISNQETRPEVGTSFMSLLITPIQRIPRYCLLLQELMSHTPPRQPQHTVIQGALQTLEGVATHLNELVTEYEEAEKLLVLARRLTPYRFEAVVPGRKILKQGRLMKVSGNDRSHPRHVVLFTDSLMVCKGGEQGPLTFSSLFPLKHCSVEPVIGTGVFKVSCQGETLLLYTADTGLGQEWIAALQSAMKQHLDCRQTLRKESSKRRPLRRKDLLRRRKESETGKDASPKTGCFNSLSVVLKRTRQPRQPLGPV